MQKQTAQSANAMVTMAMKKGRVSDLYFLNGKFEIKKDGTVYFEFASKEEVVQHILTYQDLIPNSAVSGSEKSSNMISDLVKKFSSRTHDLSVLGDSQPESQESAEEDSDEDSEDDEDSEFQADSATDEDAEDASSDDSSEEDDGEEPVQQSVTPRPSFDLGFSGEPTPDSSSSKKKGKSAQEFANAAVGITVDTKTSKGKTSAKKAGKKAAKAAKTTAKASESKGKKTPKTAEVLGTMESKEKIKEKMSKDVAPTKEPKKSRSKKEVFEKETTVDLITTLGYSPKDIRQEKKPITVQLLADRMKNNEINFKTFFQRSPDLWNAAQKSKLIESIFMNIHIPPLVFDAANPACWLVVDGLQRLSAVRHFILGMDKDTKLGKKPSKLKLVGLRALPDLNGKTYDTLPRDLQRQLNEFAFDITVLLPGTPDDIKFEIFERTNTGGLKLSEQEIRNALFNGPMTTIIKDVIDDGMFGQSTHELVPSKRSADQELILRHFSIRVYQSEYTGDNKTFFNKAMKDFNKFEVEKLETLKYEFVRAMFTAYSIWDKYSFRKVNYGELVNGKPMKDSHPFSRTLFESITVCLANLSHEDRERLIGMKDDVRAAFNYMFDDEKEFVSSLTHRTNDPKVMRQRMQYVKEAFDDLLAGTFFSSEESAENAKASEDVSEPNQTEEVPLDTSPEDVGSDESDEPSDSEDDSEDSSEE